MTLAKLLFMTAVLLPATAEAHDWSALDVNINYLDWTHRTEDRTNRQPFGQKKDFTYLEIEGARGGDWGDLYGFFDVENPTNQTDNRRDPRADRRTAAKAQARFKLTKIGAYPLMAYGHIYDFVDNGFGDQNRVLGFGTDIAIGTLMLKPFLGAHNEVKSGVGAKSNGGMGGYVLIWPFHIGSASLLVSQWHETEFARKEEFLDLAGAGEQRSHYKTSENGALALWWNATSTISAGLSYRYADNKLAVAGYEDALIYTLKYNL